MVGEKDTAHGRIKRCRKFADRVSAIQEDETTGGTEFPIEFLYQAGRGHGGLPDRNMIPNLYPWRRNATPKKLTWHQTDTTVKRHFWLTDSNPQKGKVVDAEVVGNKIVVNVSSKKEQTIDEAAQSVSLQVDHRLVDLSQPVVLEFNGESSTRDLSPSLKTLCDIMEATGDIELSFSNDIKIK